MSYAIIRIGGKQYVVREGERLLVDRLELDEKKTFHPEVLFEGGDGKAELSPKGNPVTARVVGHVLGEKIRIGKYRRRTGYRRHTGHRSRLTQIEIEAIGSKRARSTKKDDEAGAEKPKRTRSATTSSKASTAKEKDEK
jgi:large subunit ribosomal protein L21